MDLTAWYKDNVDNTPNVVGLKEPNAWGLYNLLGNDWEYCFDIYDESVCGFYQVIKGKGWCGTERSVMAITRRRSHPL